MRIRRALLGCAAVAALGTGLGAPVEAGAPSASVAKARAFADVGYPPKLRIRPQRFAVINRPGELPGASLTVKSAHWRAWGRKVASAEGRGRICGNMGSGCKSVDVRIKARKRRSLNGCRVYMLLVVTLPDSPGARLHDDAEGRDSC